MLAPGDSSAARGSISREAGYPGVHESAGVTLATVETRTWYTESAENEDVWRLVVRGSDHDLVAFDLEFNLGSVRMGDEDWIYSLAAIHNVEVLEFTPSE